MTDRRDFIRLSALASAAALLPSCGASAEYDAAVRATWRHADAAPNEPDTLSRELVRYATLAANSHNTQPWRFALAADGVTIRPDAARRTPVVDPDDHHLWVSLGCATENLAVAAAQFGRRADAGVEHGAIEVSLAPTAPTRSAAFDAILRRQCTRAEFDGRPLDGDALRQLAAAGTGAGVQVLLLTGRPRIEALTEYVLQGNSAQMRDPGFVRELKHWIRFGEAEALATRDGLFARCSGNPSVPRWLGSSMFGLLFTEDAENDKYAGQLRSSAGVAVFVAESADAAHWVDVGRCYQRFALTATMLGIRNAFVNQPVEVPAVRDQFAQWLGLRAQRPDLVVRFGRGPSMPRSLRRPSEAVIAH